uniref:Uncharacterized protein n=1 Tax=Nelumbo nucifera TaxID=4432 RepID=A0A822ZPQ6_NELNU|nr:TPA_asm: hypothetical protein HUJ06_016740 [Nelumbo nucifera]
MKTQEYNHTTTKCTEDGTSHNKKQVQGFVQNNRTRNKVGRSYYKAKEV